MSSEEIDHFALETNAFDIEWMNEYIDPSSKEELEINCIGYSLDFVMDSN